MTKRTIVLLSLLFSVIAVVPVRAATLDDLAKDVQQLKQEVSNIKSSLGIVKGDSISAVSDNGTISISKNLSVGVKDQQVVNLQEFLRQKGYFSEESTGYFGKLTEQAVKNFQQVNGIEQTGTVGPKTRAVIGGDDTRLIKPSFKTEKILFLSGGQSSNNGDTTTTLNDVYGTSDMSNWKLLSPNQSTNQKWSPRALPQVVYFQNKYWVIGGGESWAGSGFAGDAWSSSDGVTWTLATNTAPFKNYYQPKAVVLNNKIYVIGAEPVTANLPTEKVWASSDGVNWTLQNDNAPFGAKQRMSIVAYNGKIFVIGGYIQHVGYNTMQPDVWSSTDGANWTLVTSNGPMTENAATVVYNGKILALGGQLDTNTTSTPVTSVWSSTDGATWTTLTTDYTQNFAINNVDADIVIAKNKLWLIDETQSPNAKNYMWSSNDGVTWEKTSIDLPWQARGFHRMISNNGVQLLPQTCSINSFTANPTTVQEGGSTTLTWSTTGCVSAGVGTISSNGEAYGGSLSAAVNGSVTYNQLTYGSSGVYTYTLGAADQNGNLVKQTVTVTVVSSLTCSSSSKPSITVLSPNGGEVFQAGQNITVKWKNCNPTSTPSGYVLISLRKASSGALYGLELYPALSQTTNNIPNTGEAIIELPSTTTGTYLNGFKSGSDYKLEITAYSTGLGLFDISDNFFTINDSSVSTILDSTPRIAYWTGKVNQHTDSAGNWQSDPDGVSGTNIDKLTYCKKWYPNTTSVKAYKSEVITTWKRAAYFGDQSSYTNTEVTDQCVQGTIPTVQPSLMVLSPNGGEAYQTGQQITVKWKSNDAGTINEINLASPFGVATLLKNTANDGEEVVTLPDTSFFTAIGYQLGKYYKIEVITSNDIKDSSDETFTINGSTPTTCSPSITVLSPNGGEVFQAGQQITVTWKSCGIPANPYIIEISLWHRRLSTSALHPGTIEYVPTGVSFSITTNPGTYTFTIPVSRPYDNIDLNTNDYIIQIDGSINGQEGTGFMDYSDNTFTINALTTTTVDLTPRISYWWGKVNQHINTSTGAWETDPDGTSGANLNMLTYCQKWYPNTTTVKDYKMETISTWHDGGNINSYSANLMAYQCVQSSGRLDTSNLQLLQSQL